MFATISFFNPCLKFPTGKSLGCTVNHGCWRICFVINRMALPHPIPLNLLMGALLHHSLHSSLNSCHSSKESHKTLLSLYLYSPLPPSLRHPYTLSLMHGPLGYLLIRSGVKYSFKKNLRAGWPGLPDVVSLRERELRSLPLKVWLITWMTQVLIAHIPFLIMHGHGLLVSITWAKIRCHCDWHKASI